jgi:hypothetical protein
MATDTVNTETCFDSPAFSDWWFSADVYTNESFYRSQVMGCPVDGWVLDALVDCYNRGMDPIAAVTEIVAGYDPTP